MDAALPVPLRRARRARAILGLSLAPLACGEVPPGPEPPPPAAPVPVLLEVTPRDQLLIEGETTTLTAVARDSGGAVIEDAAVEWSARPVGIIAVSPAGAVQGLALGTGQVVARSGSAADTVVLPVRLRFQSLSAGAGHTCGVTTAGSAYCWGWNREGRLGNGSSAPAPAPEPVPGRASFVQVSAGWEITCGILGAGAACWGSNRSGQLGSATKSDALEPVWVIEGGRFVTVATQATHTCAVTEVGQAVWCWGAGGTGQRGTGDSSAGPPQPVAGDLRFRVVDVGWMFTCGITAGAAAWCWGTNRDGQLGRASAPETCLWMDGSRHPCALTPGPVSSTLAFDTVAVGTNHACALTPDGTAHCWGRNEAGQLGTGSTDPGATPEPVAASPTFAMLTAGDRHTCGLDAEGAAWCWGDNARGALGTAGTAESCGASPCATVPVLVNTALRFRWLTASRGQGGAHTCGLATDGLAYCWGDNQLGQVGVGRVDSGSPVPREVAGQRR